MKFRTNFNYEEFANDNEKDFPATIVETAGYQTLDEIIARCQRGLPVSVSQCVPEFEFGDVGERQLEGVLNAACEGPNSPDFDLSDLQPIAERAERAREELSKAEKQSAEKERSEANATPTSEA